MIMLKSLLNEIRNFDPEYKLILHKVRKRHPEAEHQPTKLLHHPLWYTQFIYYVNMLGFLLVI